MIQLQLSKLQKRRLFIYGLVILAFSSYYFYRIAPEKAFPFHYLGFASLPEITKDKIVWNLDDQHKWGSSEQKSICRDLLEHQGYSFANRVAWTTMAIDLAEKQHWDDLSPLIAKIYERPKDIWVYQRAFFYLRIHAGQLVSTNLISKFQTLQTAGFYDSGVSDKQLSTAKEQILQEPDKEAVLVYAINLAGSNVGKGGNARGREAAGDILKNLDRDTVVQRIRQLQKAQQDEPRYLQSDEINGLLVMLESIENRNQ